MRKMRRIIAVSTIICLIAFLFTQFETSHGNAIPNIPSYMILPRITIESDGTISPPNVPIKQVGDTTI
jgi:hypothetical protein